jgi:hypothetical protein
MLLKRISLYNAKLKLNKKTAKATALLSDCVSRYKIFRQKNPPWQLKLFQIMFYSAEIFESATDPVVWLPAGSVFPYKLEKSICMGGTVGALTIRLPTNRPCDIPPRTKRPLNFPTTVTLLQYCCNIFIPWHFNTATLRPLIFYYCDTSTLTFYYCDILTCIHCVKISACMLMRDPCMTP